LLALSDPHWGQMTVFSLEFMGRMLGLGGRRIAHHDLQENVELVTQNSSYQASMAISGP
jgi:hypothetical protein